MSRHPLAISTSQPVYQPTPVLYNPQRSALSHPQPPYPQARTGSGAGHGQKGVGVHREAKYNCYSCLDEPYERVTRSGCGAFTCPTNECIASESKYSWFN